MEHDELGNWLKDYLIRSDRDAYVSGYNEGFDHGYKHGHQAGINRGLGDAQAALPEMRREGWLDKQQRTDFEAIGYNQALQQAREAIEQKRVEK